MMLMIRYLLTVFILSLISQMVNGQPQEDKLSQLPGYPASFQNRAFAGYLRTDSEMRQLHYLYVESDKGVNNSAPVMLWLNGGPGCSSKIGFIQEITPYSLNADQPYEAQDELTFNPYGWLNTTNLLFLDTPAGVGYSINTDPNYQFNDANTAKDNLLALKDFFITKFPQYANNTFYMAGQSYAGKYIPDLAIRILSDSTHKINLKGILIGNPVLNLINLQENRVEWMISHNFIDPQLFSYWEKSCKVDLESAGCQYFYARYQDLTYRIDQANVYGQCYGRKGPIQRTLMANLAVKMSPFHTFGKPQQLLGQQWCSYDKGVENYLNVNAQQLNSKKIGTIQICNLTIYNSYKVDSRGSMDSIPHLLKNGIKTYIYTGDWDDVVPFTDTYQNIQKLNLRQQGNMIPWMVGDQHAGFIKIYSYNLTVFHVKGAGHEVPLYQRERAFRLMQKFIYA